MDYHYIRKLAEIGEYLDHRERDSRRLSGQHNQEQADRYRSWQLAIWRAIHDALPSGDAGERHE